MPTKKPKPDLVKAADNFSRKYEDVFGDKDPQDIINELRGDGDVSGASMNSSGESAAREQWIRDAIAEIEYEAYESNTVYKDSAFDTEKAIDVLARHYAAREREEWIPVSERLPEMLKDPSEVTVKLRDGSILCGAIHQTDGDWWWRERFFDASEVTHWSVAAQGEQHDH